MAMTVITTNAGRAAILSAELAGLRLNLTHIAAGDAGYTPLATATSLVNERERVAIASSRTVLDQYRLDVNAALDSPDEYWVREIGLFSDAGTLIFIWSAPEAEFTLGYKSSAIRFLVGLSLTISDVPLDVIQIIDEGQPLELSLSLLEEDLRATHLANEFHNYVGTDWTETDWLNGSAWFEAHAEFLRSQGQSGLLISRGYQTSGTEAFNRPFDGAIGAGNNIHDHANYPAVCGAAETSGVLNGYYFRTRHLDYGLDTPATGDYLAVVESATPAVPPAVLNAGNVANQIAEMQEWFSAYQRRDYSVRDYRNYFRLTLSAMEIWPEIMQPDRTYTEAAVSFRHAEQTARLYESYAILAERGATGFKGVLENNGFPVGISRQVLPTGQPTLVLWRARPICVDLGTVGTYPIHQILTLRDRPVTRWGESLDRTQLEASRHARYSINRALANDHFEGKYNSLDLTDTFMAKLPGLNGPGANITEQHTDSGVTATVYRFNTTIALNTAYYSRRHATPSDAAGRTNALRGFNDPMMFAALTTRPEVAPVVRGAYNYRVSHAMPLEIVLRTPLEAWNPYGFVEVSDTTPITGTGTLLDPYSAVRKKAFWYRTPSLTFSDGTLDPADTGAETVYVLDPNGVAQAVRASGIRIHLPEIVSGLGELRLRYPVYSLYNEASYESAMLQAVSGDIGEAVLALGNALLQQSESAAALAARVALLEAYQANNM